MAASNLELQCFFPTYRYASFLSIQSEMSFQTWPSGLSMSSGLSTYRLTTGKGLLEEPPASGVGSPPLVGAWSCELCEERLYLWGLAAKDLVRGGFPEIVQIIARLGEMLDPEVRFWVL